MVEEREAKPLPLAKSNTRTHMPEPADTFEPNLNAIDAGLLMAQGSESPDRVIIREQRRPKSYVKSYPSKFVNRIGNRSALNHNQGMVFENWNVNEPAQIRA